MKGAHVAIRGPLAAYASDAARSRGRLYAEAPSPTRSEFQRDRDRIIHCTAFRRLAHKTQVFVPLDGDHFRTRLTHTIEVGQIARALARALRCDEDLAEAVALAHDLGHTPFGHAGEGALEACMAPYGGFDHNAQALRVVTLLERRYARYDGLDLTWETLEGIVKHNGPLLPGARDEHPLHHPEEPVAGVAGIRPLSRYIAAFDAIFPLDLSTFASVEAQAAAQADDIAYIGHDIDDGLRAELFSLDDIARTPFIAGVLAHVRDEHPGLERPRVIHELVRRVITAFVEDAIGESLRRLTRISPASADEARRAGEAIVRLSPPMAEAERDIKAFLFANMYRHEKVLGVWERARDAISRLFPAFFENPELMPAEWAAQAVQLQDADRAVVVADYIAGMTDRYALNEARRLSDVGSRRNQ
ncbi:deoxyguanosinetriphosphate triphosphohydrolase [Methylocystis sp. SB2]|uniref:deoxyguanosinetriphosphate triphosphohydrolase n=1 Tax=Methylocystis sp. (strain SB2) TaxID=743836 RepID=UPI000405585D|nr:deoxyguanosinetriphosphate triphosphohydrolase [Methylocystis sp. SB2]ULO23900.1 deoxyguanosinetriphosphate triphosphohydrolase [Methylocystis sp. SB2]